MNTRNKVSLAGCAATPLASYLKALGVFRILATQEDAAARGCWNHGRFALDSQCDGDQLVAFFLNRYAPSPLIAPWNGGSGFYEGDDTHGLAAIVASNEAKLASYRETIRAVQQWTHLAPASQPVAVMREKLAVESTGMSGKAEQALRDLLDELDLAVTQFAEYAPAGNLLQGPVENLDRWKVTGKGLSERDKGQNLTLKAVVRAARKIRSSFKKGYRAAGKETLVTLARATLPDAVVECLDAMLPLLAGGTLGYPPLFGAGGSEGRFDYTNAFMGHVAAMLIVPTASTQSESLLRHALFGDITEDLQNAAVGQHDPGRAGGFNQGPEIETKQVPMNPWNFILCMEGCIAWGCGAARRFGPGQGSVLVSPFTVNARSAGYGSASDQDEAKAEVRAPLWDAPATYFEVQQVLREGRAEVGTRRARHAVEFAEAVASLGVDRGIREFTRFSLLKRRGDSYVALPAGSFPVQYRSESDLVRELDTILAKVDRFITSFQSTEPPARFTSLRRQVDEAIYDLLLRGGAIRVARLIATLGRLEKLFAQRDLTKEPKLVAPLLGLSPRWILAADDGSIEVRLAAALSSITACGKVGPLRANLAPVDRAKPWDWARQNLQTAWFGNTVQARFAEVLARRMMDAERLNAPANPLAARLRLHPSDAVAVLAGPLDLARLEDLLFGMTWIRWENTPSAVETCREAGRRWASPVRDLALPRPYVLLKHLFLSEGVRLPGQATTISVRAEPSVLALLRANRTGEACAVAQRRLYTSGLNVLRSTFPDAAQGTALAAALLVPVQQTSHFTGLILQENNTNI